MAIGAFMLVPWIRRRGLRPAPAARGLAPVVTLGHAGAAGAGLLAWIAYLVTGWSSLGWLAVGILLAVIGLGMATLTVWTAQASRGRPRPAGAGGRAAARPPGRPADHRPDRARPGRQRDDPARPAHRGDRAVSRREWPAGHRPNSLQA